MMMDAADRIERRGSVQEIHLDPDSPPWSARAALKIWLFSIAGVMVAPLVFLAAASMLARLQGNTRPPELSELNQWAQTPAGALLQVVSYICVHVISIVLCIRMVMRATNQPLAVALGLRWTQGGSIAATTALVLNAAFGASAITLLIALAFPLPRNFLFDLLESGSEPARIATAVMMIVSAPVAEEMIYRGVLYASVRRSFGIRASILIVSSMFALVHFPQYSDALALMVGVTILGLALTYVRAKTKTILPCIAIHAAYNACGVAFVTLTRVN
jgi:uncharacterized protein